jgi:hypothetical protein
MSHRNDIERHRRVLDCLSRLPRKIMSVHELENVPEFVLQDICNEHCFNIIRAAYLVDNPDFNQLKGIAGFCREEAYDHPEHIWEDYTSFTAFMRQSAFNNQVRSLLLDSIDANHHMHDHIIARVAPQLGFTNPAWCTWDLKHYNHGLIIYEKADLAEDTFDEHFINTLYLLGFCAIQ